MGDTERNPIAMDLVSKCESEQSLLLESVRYDQRKSLNGVLASDAYVLNVCGVAGPSLGEGLRGRAGEFCTLDISLFLQSFTRLFLNRTQKHMEERFYLQIVFKACAIVRHVIGQSVVLLRDLYCGKKKLCQKKNVLSGWSTETPVNP